MSGLMISGFLPDSGLISLPTIVNIIYYLAIPCSLEPCQNYGICSKLEDESYHCECMQGYTGVDCETGKSREMVVCQNTSVLDYWLI